MSAAPRTGGDSMEWGQSQGVTHHVWLHCALLTGGWKWDIRRFLVHLLLQEGLTLNSDRVVRACSKQVLKTSRGRNCTARPNALQSSWGSIFSLSIWSETPLLKFMTIIFCCPDMHLHMEPGFHLPGNTLTGTGQVPEAFSSPG